MGKTIRFDRRDDDSSTDNNEPMTLSLYNYDDCASDSFTLVDLVPGCERVRIGDVYRLDQAGTVVECWITGNGDSRGEFLALVTVSRGPVQIAARLLSLPESFLAGMLLTDYQAISEVEPIIIDATG